MVTCVIFVQVLRKLGYISPLVDDVLVLNFVSVLDKGVFARMRLREVIDASWENHELILYPSEFDLRLLTTFREKVSFHPSHPIFFFYLLCGGCISSSQHDFVLET
jgi:hypothetical protein